MAVVVVVGVVATIDVAELVITVGVLAVAITFDIDVVGETTMTLCSCEQFLVFGFDFSSVCF